MSLHCLEHTNNILKLERFVGIWLTRKRSKWGEFEMKIEEKKDIYSYYILVYSRHFNVNIGQSRKGVSMSSGLNADKSGYSREMSTEYMR